MGNPNQFKFLDKYIRKRSHHYDQIVYEDELQNHYKIVGKCADAVLHKPKCKWHIIESKGTDIDKAIMQLENTLENLKGKKVRGIDFKPELLIIIAKKIGSRYKWRKSKKNHFLRDPNIRDPNHSNKKIKGLHIKLIYYSQILGQRKFPEDFDSLEGV
jgi:hypothetical protein